MNASTISDRRRLLAGSVGNVLEWYDFAVYGFLAPLMGPLFFPDEDPLAALINTYGIFAAGYIVRPVGGVIFGYIGDRMGRKRALQLSIAMMAIPTVLVGLLPVHAQVGTLAAVLLVVLRLVQGVSVGGELVGSMSYLVETAPASKRGLAGSWSVTGGVGGILLGSLVVTIFSGIFGQEAMASWGWRVPFLAGGLIFFIGRWLRQSLEESAEFTASQDEDDNAPSPLATVLREMPTRVLHLSTGILLYATAFYMLFVWLPAYLMHIVVPAVPHAMVVNSISMVLLLLTIPYGGHLSDRFGRKPVMLSAIAMLGLTIYPLFLVLDHGVLWQAACCQLFLAVLVGLIQGPVPAFMVECFPVRNRYTAIGLSYNITLALFGGTAPMVSTWLIRTTGDIASPALYLAALAAVSFCALSVLKTLTAPVTASAAS